MWFDLGNAFRLVFTDKSSMLWNKIVSLFSRYQVTADKSQLDNSSLSTPGGRFFVSSHTGLWKTCRTVRTNGSDESK